MNPIFDKIITLISPSIVYVVNEWTFDENDDGQWSISSVHRTEESAIEQMINNNLDEIFKQLSSERRKYHAGHRVERYILDIYDYIDDILDYNYRGHRESMDEWNFINNLAIDKKKLMIEAYAKIMMSHIPNSIYREKYKVSPYGLK